MGYRSDVTIAFYSRDPNNVPGAALKLWFDENYPHKEADKEWNAKITRGNDYVLVQYYDVKWYSGYSHVDAVDMLVRKFEELFECGNDHTAAYEYIRVGEESNDIMQDRSDFADYFVDVRREIVTSFD